jgi:hypothetical protein
MRTIIGIDPGINGGIAWIDENGRACAEKMPDTIGDLWELIEDIQRSQVTWPEKTPCKAYLEQVASSPQMGVVSAFTFGRGYGNLEMALTAAGIPFERVRPQVWQGALNCLTGGDKRITKRKAQELFPGIKITHKIAESLLIAEYGRRKHTP